MCGQIKQVIFILCLTWSNHRQEADVGVLVQVKYLAYVPQDVSGENKLIIATA